MNGTDSFRAVRDRQITWGLGALSILGLLPLLVSLFGSPTRGYRNTALYTGLYIIVLFTALLSNRLPLIIRATVLIGVPLVLGITGLFTWGLPWGLPALLTFCILVTMFSGKRTGILAAGLTIMIILIAGILFRSGILQLPFDPRIYLTSYVAWIAALTGIAISAGFDRHEEDWGGLLKTEDYFTIGKWAKEASLERCQGRRFGVLEGGYNHSVLGRNVKSFLQGLSD